jgi:hypothetical protein
MAEEWKSYWVEIIRGPGRGQKASVVGYSNVGHGKSSKRELTCKLSDGTYKMISEERARRLPEPR